MVHGPRNPDNGMLRLEFRLYLWTILYIIMCVFNSNKSFDIRVPAMFQWLLQVGPSLLRASKGEPLGIADAGCLSSCPVNRRCNDKGIAFGQGKLINVLGALRNLSSLRTHDAECSSGITWLLCFLAFVGGMRSTEYHSSFHAQLLAICNDFIYAISAYNNIWRFYYRWRRYRTTESNRGKVLIL